MISYIIIGITLVMLAAAVLTVVPERALPRNSGIGKAFRFVRIRLREMSRTSFCVVSMILLAFGLIAHIGMKMLLIAIGIMLLTLIILHPEDFIAMFRTRKRAVRKKDIPRTGKRMLNKGRTPEAARLTELTPLIVDEKVKG
ncbi:MAG: hypothetical protein IJ779_07870 [Ruminococcus sp.]|nr:hypothetical protein [Ruminococcus sp.]